MGLKPGAIYSGNFAVVASVGAPIRYEQATHEHNRLRTPNSELFVKSPAFVLCALFACRHKRQFMSLQYTSSLFLRNHERVRFLQNIMRPIVTACVLGDCSTRYSLFYLRAANDKAPTMLTFQVHTSCFFWIYGSTHLDMCVPLSHK